MCKPFALLVFTFRIFLFTRSTDLNLTPDAAALVATVNFSVTRSGLESQLLGATIKHERPQMEEQKVDLLQKEEGLKVKLAALEESLLSDLANSHGNILDNTNLIESLKMIKTQSKDIAEARGQSSQLQSQLDAKREFYRPFAATGSRMFFLLQEMKAIGSMYQLSLASHLNLFHLTLAANADEHAANATDDEVTAKMQYLSPELVKRAFLYMSRGLFKADRVPFGIHVVRGIFPQEFPQPLWEVFTGLSKADAGGMQAPPWAHGNPNTVAAELAAVHQADPSLLQRWRLDDANFWQAWYRERKPWELLLGQCGMGSLEAIMFVQVFFKERIVETLTAIVLAKLGIPALAEVATVEALIPETTSTQPVLLLTSAGADPSLEVQEVAYKMVGKERFTQIALGGGQTDEAMAQLRRCAIQGEWIFLKNCHLVLDWVSGSLEKELSAMTTPHEEFRVFLTTEAHDAFPSVLLKSSLKVTVESPPGVKQNMLRTYGAWPAQWYDSLPPVHARLLFVCAWLHAVISERRAYVPQGWAKMYEFTAADLKSAADVSMALTKGDNVDWLSLRGMFEFAIYGGRLDNPQDEGTLHTLLERTLNDQVLHGRMALYGELAVPTGRMSHAATVQLVSSLPDVNHPTMFQLPDNADNVVLENQGQRFRQDLKALTLADVEEGGDGKAAAGDALRTLLAPVVAQLGPVVDGLQAPPMPAPPAAASGKFPDPVEVYLFSELGLLGGLVRKVKGTFAQAKAVVDGAALPDDALRANSVALAAFAPPMAWADAVPGASADSLAAYLAALSRKCRRCAEWHRLHAGGSGALLTSRLNLTELLRPFAFLNALRQFTARKAGVSLANLKLVGGVAAASQASRAAVSVMLDGSSLQLQGATFDGQQLALAMNSTPSASPFADLGVGWVPAAQDTTQQGVAKLPLYGAQDRELRVMELTVPTGQSTPDDWTIRGAAAFLAGPE